MMGCVQCGIDIGTSSSVYCGSCQPKITIMRHVQQEFMLPQDMVLKLQLALHGELPHEECMQLLIWLDKNCAIVSYLEES